MKPTITKVIQIYDIIPNELTSCVIKWKSWAEDRGYTYIHLPLSLNGYVSKAGASNEQRIKYLAENPYTLYADWDTYPSNLFELPSYPCIIDDSDIDSLQWNYNDTSMWKNLSKEYTKYKLNVPTYIHERGRGWKLMRKLGFNNLPRFPKNSCTHLKYHNYGHS